MRPLEQQRLAYNGDKVTAATRPVNLLIAESAEIRSTDVSGADTRRSSVRNSAGDTSQSGIKMGVVFLSPSTQIPR